MTSQRSSCTGRQQLFSLLVVALLFCCVAAKAARGMPHDKVVVCYISTWAAYRPPDGAYRINQFDPKLCTHAVYAFAGLDVAQSAIKSLDPWQDLTEDYGNGGYNELTGFKRSYPHLKVSLAIGGWNEGSANYSSLVADPTRRGRFVKQVTSFVRKYNFDGLDLDWEYPTQRGGVPQDRENFVALAKELREEFDKYNLLLTSAIGAAKHVIDEAYDVRQLSRYLDYLHIMCYDYHGSWDKKIGYNAPLTAASGDVLSVQYTIEYLIKLGAPLNKIVVGLPFYGRTFQTPFEGNIGDDSDGIGFQGPYTRENGFLGYNEICHMLSNKTLGWTTEWDQPTAQVLARSTRDPVTGLVQAVTYDNARSIANKVKFTVMHNLAGVMVWSIDTDDFQGHCQPDVDTFADFDSQAVVPQRFGTKYPLMQTINEALTLASEMYERKKTTDVPNDIDNEIPHGTIEDRKGGSGGAGSVLSQLLLMLTVLSIISQVAHV